MRKISRRIAAIAAIVAGCSLSVSAQWAVNGTHIYNTNTGKVGIGTGATTPAGQLTVKGAGSTPAPAWVTAGAPFFVAFGENTAGNSDFNLNMASNASNARPVVLVRHSRGTLAAPLVVANNDFLGSVLTSGYDGSAFQNPSGVEFFVDGVPSAGNVPARLSFVTGSNSLTRAERLKVGSTGNFNFNGTQLTLTQATGDLSLGSGNFTMGSGAKTLQFGSPVAGGSGMMTMFPSGTQNVDRMVLQHSPAYPSWGLQYQDSLDKFNFLSGGSPVLTADLGSQRVGIGTSSPGARLDIAGFGSYNLAASNGDFRLGDANYNLKMGVANSGGGAGDAYIAGSGRLYLGAGNIFGRTQTVAVNSDGTVGIGNYIPGAKLGVVGDTANTNPIVKVTSSYVGSSDVRGISITSKSSDGWGYGIEATGGFIGGYMSSNAGAYTGTGFGVYGVASGSTAGTRIGVYGTASGGSSADLNWGGYFPTKTYTSELRVGGTQGATGYVAAINGKLIATEVRVELIANWPDYVFSGNHKLMSLEELEASIKANKHLPGIPSAAEVKSGGIMLGEMQTKTMEKLEENTLYIIELNKKLKTLDELDAKIKLLEQKIEALNKVIN